MVWDGGAPATDVAGLSRLWTATGQRDGLDVLVEVGWPGQTDHHEAVQGRAVRAVTDHVSDRNVLLGALLRRHVVFSEGCNGAVGAAKMGERGCNL